MEQSPILELQHITHSFSGPKPILNDVNLKLFPGQAYTLMGANGSGKTTLFNVIGGYIRPERGLVFFRERDITLLPPNKINRLGVGRTFQKPRLIKHLTLLENVILAMPHNQTDIWYKALLPRFVYSGYLRILEEKAEEVLERFLLCEKRDELVASISYGQQKMLNLACLVANEGQLLLLDEPVAGLSPSYARRLTDSLIQLKAEGKTILMIEHSQALTQRVTDEYFLLDRNGIKSYTSFESLRLEMTRRLL